MRSVEIVIPKVGCEDLVVFVRFKVVSTCMGVHKCYVFRVVHCASVGHDDAFWDEDAI